MHPCLDCPRFYQPVPASGPKTRGGVLFVGEAPGPEENKRGMVFIGKTGQEVDQHYLPLAGLRREQCTFTNAIKCYPINAGGKLDIKSKKDRMLLDSCADFHLREEIRQMQPSLVVPMGAFACAAFGNIDLERQHGYPLDHRNDYVLFPMYHPALGLHEPKKMLLIRNDWVRLKKLMGDTLPLVLDRCPKPDYREAAVSEILNIDPDFPMGCDTESSSKGEPYCFTFSQEYGKARLIWGGDREHLDVLNQKLAKFRAPILFHNWLYDWPVTEKMGLKFPLSRIVDTMQRVYHLGNLPQGLKSLAWRELGMEMQDFDDLVTPFSSDLCYRYLQRAAREKWEKPETQLVRSPEGTWKTYQPQSVGTKLKRFFTDIGNNPDKDIFGAWDNWEAQWPEIEERMGPWPGKCISHVPVDDALYYACRDADALLRLWWVIKRMSANVRHYSQEEWRR